MTTSTKEEPRFGFGSNWSDYVGKHFSSERVETAKAHLLGFLKLDDLKGRSFLDIGCGSGLHSLAALQAGASHITSFDYDEQSVETTMKLHELAGGPPNWEVMQGSVLDRSFIASLPTADIVYSWGVLHHTGSMWEAVENATRCMVESSVFYVALYASDAHPSPPPEYWIKVKRAYNKAGPLKRCLMESKYVSRQFLGMIKSGRNPITHVVNYKANRGMSYWHDLKDWLGGYPMEFAGNKETELFCREKLGLTLCNIKAGAGNTEFLFHCTGESVYWDDLMASAPPYALEGPFEHVGGFGWSARAPSEGIFGSPAAFMLYENGSPVGWPEAPLEKICKWGRGRYRVEDERLIFSTTDGADPNSDVMRFEYRTDFDSSGGH